MTEYGREPPLDSQGARRRSAGRVPAVGVWRDGVLDPLPALAYPNHLRARFSAARDAIPPSTVVGVRSEWGRGAGSSQ